MTRLGSLSWVSSHGLLGGFLLIQSLLSAVSGQPLPTVGVLGDLQASRELQSFASLISNLSNSTGYVGFLNKVTTEYQGITIFAPNNAAFDDLGPGPRSFRQSRGPVGPYSACLHDYHRAGSMMQTVASNHIILGKWPAASLQSGSAYYTLSNTYLAFTRNGTGTFVNDAAVITPDLYLDYDGVVHVIDKVLLPPGLSNSLYSVCGNVTLYNRT